MDVPRMQLTSGASSPGGLAEYLEELPARADALPIILDANESADWATESEAEAWPLPQPAASPAAAGRKCKRKTYPSDIAAKKDRRRKKHEREKDDLGPTALCAPTYAGAPSALATEMHSVSHLPANQTGYSADCVESIRPGRLWTQEELEEMDFGVLHWDGERPVTILDDGGRVVAVLVGRPLRKPGVQDDWPEVVAGLDAAINQLERDSSFSDKQNNHRRGPHRAKAFGISHGGGQQVHLQLLRFIAVGANCSPAPVCAQAGQPAQPAGS
ncbi:hypothetical protein HWV62_11419 [Athelia sp. TMB]|nr:hypothetical protein HWV62_11419 [Athelia sp. TMB]